MKEDEILISVPIKKKPYYNSDVIQSCMQDGQMAYKNGKNFFLFTVDNHKKMMKMIKQIIKLEAEQEIEKKGS